MTEAMHGLALCAGIGGIELGLAAAVPGYRTVCYVEREAFCAGILAARMADGWLDDAPIWSDLAAFDARPWRGIVDIVSAGYPCQPFSAAGKRRGEHDPRHLWPHVARVIGECQPAFAFLENVPGHVSLGLQDVCADLRDLGYAVSAGIFSAAECGAPHIRKRLFILAAHPDRADLWQQSRGRSGSSGPGAAKPGNYGEASDVADANGDRQPQPQGGQPQGWGRAADGGADMADPHSDGRQQGISQPTLLGRWQRIDSRDWWAAEPPVGRVVDGFPHRVDELRALGNAVVPHAAARAWRCLGQGLQ